MAIHIYLEPKRKAKDSKAKDASSVAQVEKEIANEERLLKARGQTNSTRLKMLKEELEKAKLRTGNAGEKFYVKNMSGQVVKTCSTRYEADKYVSEHQSERLHVYTTTGQKDAVNHLGEKEYNTYAAWRAACKAANPSVVFEGDKDICNAKPGVGEWDGNTGVVYNKTKDAPEDDDQILKIQNKYHCSRMDAVRRYYSGERVKDAQKPYISLSGKTWEVLNSEGKVVRTYPNSPGGMAREKAQQYLKDHWDELSGKVKDGFEENKHPRASNGEFGSGGGSGGKSKKPEAKKNPPHVEAHTIPELKAHVEAYNKALKEFRAGVAHGEEILARTHNVAEKNAYLEPLSKKLDQAEKKANQAIKAYSQKTKVNVELVGFNGKYISKYN